MDVKRNKSLISCEIKKNIFMTSKKLKAFKNNLRFHKFTSNKKINYKKKIEEEKTAFTMNNNINNKGNNLIDLSENVKCVSSPNKILIVEENSNSKNNTENSIVDTEKIDYRYHKNFNANDLIQENNLNNNNNNNKKYHWLATYDKLMQKNKMLKILNFYSKKKLENLNDNIIEKCIKIDDFEIFYNINSDIPYIRPMKNNYILVKLYLLTYDQINLVLSYINRVTKKIVIDENLYRNDLIEKGKYEKLFSNVKYYPYTLMYYLGNYMNYNIISFSNFFYSDKIWIHNNFKNSQNHPSAKNIANLVKLLMINFPDKNMYNMDFFIFYLLENVKYINFNKKYEAIKEILLNTDINKKNKRKVISCLDDVHSNFSKINNNYKNNSDYVDITSSRRQNNEEEGVIVGRFNSLENFKNKFIDSFEKKDVNLNYSLNSNTDSTNSKMINSQIGIICNDNSKYNNEYDITMETLTFNFQNLNNTSNQKNQLVINNYENMSYTQEISKKIPLNIRQDHEKLSYDCSNSTDLCSLHKNKLKIKFTKKSDSTDNKNKIANKKNNNSPQFFNKKIRKVSTCFKKSNKK